MNKTMMRWLSIGMLAAIAVLLLIQQIPFIGGYAMTMTILAAIVLLVVSFTK